MRQIVGLLALILIALGITVIYKVAINDLITTIKIEGIFNSHTLLPLLFLAAGLLSIIFLALIFVFSLFGIFHGKTKDKEADK